MCGITCTPEQNLVRVSWISCHIYLLRNGYFNLNRSRLLRYISYFINELLTTNDENENKGPQLLYMRPLTQNMQISSMYMSFCLCDFITWLISHVHMLIDHQLQSDTEKTSKGPQALYAHQFWNKLRLWIYKVFCCMCSILFCWIINLPVSYFIFG